MITRRDLPAGHQATQTAHAALNFAVLHPELTRRWRQTSSYLVLLAVADEAELAALDRRLDTANLITEPWHEPDWDGALTAVAVEPGPRAGRLLANLPLTGREPAMV